MTETRLRALYRHKKLLKHHQGKLIVRCLTWFCFDLSHCSASAKLSSKSCRKEKKAKKAKQGAEKPTEQAVATSSGPGNAEEAQQMRQQLGETQFSRPSIQADTLAWAPCKAVIETCTCACRANYCVGS